MRVRVWGSAAAAVSVAALALAPGAVATSSPVSTKAVTEYGRVTFVPDGDTIDVKIDDVKPDAGRTGTRIRFVGLQAMEQHTYKVDLTQATGECHALEATARLREILGGERNDYRHRRTDGARVMLSAKDSSSSSRNRELRMVSTKDALGDWQDVAITMLTDGMTLPFFNGVEYTHNKEYRVAARAAAAQNLGIWNPDSCPGNRPSPHAQLAMHVNWDAPGDDAKHLNGEYFRVTNTGTTTASLSGWWVRDSSLRDFFHFPKGASIRPGQKVFVHVGKGLAKRSTNGNQHFYWGQTTPAFENITGAPKYMGDGGYLFDTIGNLRAWEMYGH
ncbi:lamin tail domain-containing protein [Spongisporangium articulatum]|uniref:Lamin tail domain-containing protein n=1 Tax=Spongisporangium articulatum TaxID=3362603 RepID=A0ABW8AM12_9ACTN